MFSSIPKTPYKWHFIIYCISFIGCGGNITFLGPLLPYVAEVYGGEITQYSFLFLARAIGYLLGSFLSKIWQRFFTFHQVNFFSSVMMGAMLILILVVPNLALKTCFIFIAGIMNAQLDVFLNMCIIEEQKHNRLDFWMQVSHGAFGIGGLLGPCFVFLLGFQSFTVLGVIFLVSSPAYIILSSPEVSPLQHEQQQKLLSGQEQNFEQKKIPLLPKLLLCLMFLLAIGQQIAIGGWISSYSVLAGISNKQFATIYGVSFQVTMTLCRFLFSLIPGSASKKLIFFICGTIFGSISSLLIITYGNGEAGMFYSCVVFGITISVMFPLLFSVPVELGFSITSDESSDIMICAALGEGVIAVIVGYFMNFFGINMLFYSILGISFILLITLIVMVKLLNNENEKDTQEIKTSKGNESNSEAHISEERRQTQLTQ